jgi:hypothetical protein
LAHMYSSSTFQGSGKKRLLRLRWKSNKQLKHAQAKNNQSTDAHVVINYGDPKWNSIIIGCTHLAMAWKQLKIASFGQLSWPSLRKFHNHVCKVNLGRLQQALFWLHKTIKIGVVPPNPQGAISTKGGTWTQDT